MTDVRSSLEASDDLAATVAVAPRVSLADIEAKIDVEYFVSGKEIAAGGKGWDKVMCPGSLAVLTICVLVLRNGFTVVGKSAPASAANFDAEVGRKFAREDAIRQVWTLEGYALRDRLAAG